MTDRMKIATEVIADADASEIAPHLAGVMRDRMDDRSVDLALLFGSAHFEEELDRIALDLHEHLAPRCFIGASAEAVIHGNREYEGRPAVTLWAAHLPDVRVRSFHLSAEDVNRLTDSQELQEHLNVPAGAEPYFLLLGDPFTANVLDLLARLEQAYPGRPAIGGMASGASGPEQNAVIFGGHTLRHGMVGAALWGDVRIDAVVSQGCRPIGQHAVITRAERNVVFSLGGKPPLQFVIDLLRDCDARDRQLVESRGLFLGRAINEYQPRFTQGDFLIRNPRGFDRESGAMALDDFVRTGQTVQFHVRDADSASEDLQTLLTARQLARPDGALLFSCNGRGLRLFDEPSHDARAIARHTRGAPLAGLFCAGEIGPIGGRNFLHGHTASIGLVRPADASTHA